MQTHSILFSSFGRRHLFAGQPGGTESEHSPCDRVIKSVLAVGANDYWKIFLSRRDRWLLRKGLGLAQEAGFSVSPSCLTEVANLNKGEDFLDKNFRLKADIVFICFVYDPPTSVGGLNIHPAKQVSPHHYQKNIWSDAVRATGAKIIITAVNSDKPLEIGVSHFKALRFEEGPSLRARYWFAFHQYNMAVQTLIKPGSL